jgi:hypothetical protein
MLFVTWGELSKIHGLIYYWGMRLWNILERELTRTVSLSDGREIIKNYLDRDYYKWGTKGLIWKGEFYVMTPCRE